MIIWVDAHLSPAIAVWINSTFGITALALRDVGLRDAEDPQIFEAAKARGVILLTLSGLKTLRLYRQSKTLATTVKRRLPSHSKSSLGF